MINISFGEILLVLLVAILVIKPQYFPKTAKLHLIELRNRVILCSIVAITVFSGFCLFANNWYDFIALHLFDQLPKGGSLIATEITAPFLTPIKLCYVSAITLCLPFILYQTWAFVAPGLYKHEKRIIFPLVIISCGLFYLGMAFSFFVICPLTINFLLQSAPSKVTVMTDMTNYLDFILSLLFAGGIAFEIPIITVILVKLKLITVQQLKEKRPIIIVGTFILSMLLTPPDVISQVLLAIPMLILFELGVVLAAKTDYWILRVSQD